MKRFFKGIELIDLVSGILIYLTLFLFAGGISGRITSYQEIWEYGFPLPVMVKITPTDFCLQHSPRCAENYPESYSPYSFDDPIHVFRSVCFLLIDAFTLFFLMKTVSMVRRKLL